MRNQPLLVGLIVTASLLSVWLFSERHFLRMIPLPLAAISFVYDGPFSVPTPMQPRGDYLATRADITTPSGLRAALDDIQRASPLVATTRPPLADFTAWVKLVTSTSMQCTDGTLLFQLAAWAQGIPVREWWLLPAGWLSGGGHSVVEFLNPRTGQWQLVDAQHAATITDPAGHSLSMADVLALWRDGRQQDVVIDYGPFRAAMLSGARGPSVEDYFFKFRLLDQPVINLNPLGVVATAARKEFVIGWVVYGAGAHHDTKVILSKVAAVTVVACLAAAALLQRRQRRRRRAS